MCVCALRMNEEPDERTAAITEAALILRVSMFSRFNNNVVGEVTDGNARTHSASKIPFCFHQGGLISLWFPL